MVNSKSRYEIQASPIIHRSGVIASTILRPYTLGVDRTIEVSTMDLRRAHFVVGSKDLYVPSMLGDFPFETSVYSLIDRNEPLNKLEELFGDELFVGPLYRRDLVAGDLYLSRSRGEEDAALEHQDVIDRIQSGTLLLLTQDERMAVYGPGTEF